MVPTWLPLMLLSMALSVAVAVLQYQRRTAVAVFCGGLASLLFVAVAVVGRMETGDRLYSLIVIGGLLLNAAGSTMLALGGGKGGSAALAGFGMTVFLLGHAAYLGALVYRGYIAAIIAVPLTLIAGAVLTLLLLKRKRAPKKHRAFIVGYLLVPVLVFCWSAALLILNSPDPTYHVFTLGALGLIVFDIDLLFRLFGRGQEPAAHAAACVAYATGQLLIALSVLFA